MFHVIKYIKIVRLLFLKMIKFEEKNVIFSKNNHQIVSPLMQNEWVLGGYAYRINSTPKKVRIAYIDILHLSHL